MIWDILHACKFLHRQRRLCRHQVGVGIHGDGDRLQILKSILADDQFNVRVLRKQQMALLVDSTHFDSEEPVQFTEVHNFDML